MEREGASSEVRYVADWIATTGDNQAMPYLIVDKVDARVYVFDATGRLSGAAPALLGMERGDGSVEGLGKRALAIGPEQRTTPAGRFVASLGLDLTGQDILWVDYDTSLALHRVVKGTPRERRAQRLQSPGRRRQPHFIWLHQCASGILRGDRQSRLHALQWRGLHPAGDEPGPGDLFKHGGGDVAPAVP